MSRLNARQRAALEALRGADGAALTVGRLAGLLDTSPEGASMTASSLVRRGLAERVPLHQRVAYRAAS